MKKTYQQLVELFEQTNRQFLSNDVDLILSDVNERTICGAFMLHLHDQIKDDVAFDGYHTDIEYNRNQGQIKTAVKTIQGPDMKIIRINCDLILHSRGHFPEQDNLIAIEMKKSGRTKSEKNADRDRLVALTADSFDNIWSFDGRTLPEHVCRYVLGVYYEIDGQHNKIKIEYYHRSERVKQYEIKISE